MCLGTLEGWLVGVLVGGSCLDLKLSARLPSSGEYIYIALLLNLGLIFQNQSPFLPTATSFNYKGFNCASYNASLSYEILVNERNTLVVWLNT